ncbi:MAG: bifunctional phosphopantothenoylcysteine decarboxylase/phosphopantothenate synthase [Pseudomonadota bacterium]|jgi:phosphopantothenoylcysteine decarboxylase/phosphopantothenate--cysteine ligase
MMEIGTKRIILGVTGGIAAYKAAELARLMVKAGSQVHVVLTEGGAKFVTPVTFAALTGHRVHTDLWDDAHPNNMAHIDLTRGAAAIVVAPASADFLAKLAHGLADDLLSTLCLARDCPLIVAPAMNRQMWENPATVRNIRTLREDGVVVLGPASGEQACGEVGPGRMLEPAELFERIAAWCEPKPLHGLRVLLTAGPTFEAIDPVRGITNSSSGKMGYALATAAMRAGAHTTLVSGPTALAAPIGVTRIDVASAEDMRAAVMARVAEADIFISVAAVADYRPAHAAEQKIKKSAQNLTLELVPNPDILAEVAALPTPPFCVGFAAESQHLSQYANAKRIAKRLPLVVGNLVQEALGADESRVVLFDDHGEHPLPAGPKAVLARDIIHHISRLFYAGREHE